MTNKEAIERLKALSSYEIDLELVPRPWASRADQDKLRQKHRDNREALGLAILTLELLDKGPSSIDTFSPPENNTCPTPRQEVDELVCTRCWLRWSVGEDKPKCLEV